MNADDLLTRLDDVLNGHRWAQLPILLHPDFTCLLVHTGERFTRDEWVRFNAEYPGFQGYELVDRVVSGDRAAARAHVTGLVAGRLRHFEVAEFLTAKNGLIADLVEVWAGLDQAPPTRDNR